MDNEKLFELMTKMYGEMQKGFKDVDNRFDRVEDRLDRVENRLDRVENRLDKIEVIIENEIKPDIKLSLEGYSLVYEKLETLETKFDALAEKQSNQEVEIRVIKATKQSMVK